MAKFKTDKKRKEKSWKTLVKSSQVFVCFRNFAVESLKQPFSACLQQTTEIENFFLIFKWIHEDAEQDSEASEERSLDDWDGK